MPILNDQPASQNNPLPVCASASPSSWSSTGPALTTTADRVLLPAQGGTLRGYLCGLQMANAGNTATEIVVKDGASVLWRFFLRAGAEGSNVGFVQPLRTSANTALGFACLTAGAAVYVNAQGYVA